MLACWGDHLGDVWAFVNYCLMTGQVNVSTIADNGESIRSKLLEISSLFDSNHKLILHDKICTHYDVVDEFACWQMPYIKTKIRWSGVESKTVSTQLTGGRLHADLKNLSPEFNSKILSEIKLGGYDHIELGINYTLEECVSIIAGSRFFIGIDSGMSHVAHSVGVPMVLVKNKLEFSQYHVNKNYYIADDIDGIKRAIRVCTTV